MVAKLMNEGAHQLKQIGQRDCCVEDRLIDGSLLKAQSETLGTVQCKAGRHAEIPAGKRTAERYLQWHCS